MKFKLATFIKRSVVLAAIVAAMGSATMAGEAKALNPDQKQVAPIVNAIYWDLVRFWGPSTKPAISYYDNGYADYWTQCTTPSWTRSLYGSQGLYCNNNIYLDYYQQLGNISKFGDGAVAFWLAHEFAHDMEAELGVWAKTPYYELVADCFAGMYFRYGIWTSKWLNNYNDLANARNQIWALSWNDPDHGNPQERLRAFDFGLKQTYYMGCVNGAGVNY